MTPGIYRFGGLGKNTDLVASKVPEREIYATLASLKHGSAHAPAKVFASHMRSYAAQKADTRSQSLHIAMQDMKKKMTLH